MLLAATKPRLHFIFQEGYFTSQNTLTTGLDEQWGNFEYIGDINKYVTIFEWKI